MANRSINKIQNFALRIASIKPDEFSAALMSFFFVLILMASWYILRPVRDGLVSEWTDAEVSWLITIAFGFCFAAVSVYGFAVTHVRFKILVPALYSVFGLSFFAFYIALNSNINQELIEKSFFIWMSVFGLFHVSVFWSLMTDLFSKAQSQRVFGFIASGSSVGAIIGPLVPLFLAERLGTNNLILVASGLLLFLTLPLIIRLEIMKANGKFDEADQPKPERKAIIGGNPLEGFRAFLSNPYLLAIGLFILLYTAISTFVYFELKNLMAIYDETTRQKIWAGIDLAVNLLSVLTAWFVTSHIVRRFGLAITLALMPFIIFSGLLIVAFSIQLGVVVALQVLRRAGNYSITRPAREMLFSAVDRESRLKAKPVIDIVVYRGGDMLTAWAFTGLTHIVGLSLAGVAVIGAGIAGLWTIVAIYLGRHYVARDSIDKTTDSAVDKSVEIGNIQS